MKKIILWILIILTVVSLFSCGGNAEEKPNEKIPFEENGSPEEKKEKPIEKPDPDKDITAPGEITDYPVSDHLRSLKVYGRFEEGKNGIDLDYTASGVEFRFRCDEETDVGFSFALSSTVQPITLRVWLDGKRGTDVTLTASASPTVCAGVPAGDHTLKVLRETSVESSSGGVTPLGLTLTSIRMQAAFLQRPADADLFVEFVGDSITCGMGAKGAADGTQYGLDTYAMKFCEAVGCDHSVVSVSGIGVNVSTGRHGGSTINSIYPYVNAYRAKTEYLPDRTADLVVVNLGTNDSGTTESAFKASVRNLVESIHEAHGDDVKIVWICAMMIPRTSAVNGYVQDVFTSLGGEEAGLYVLTVQTDNSGYANHPGPLAHTDTASMLKFFLEEKDIL